MGSGTSGAAGRRSSPRRGTGSSATAPGPRARVPRSRRHRSRRTARPRALRRLQSTAASISRLVVSGCSTTADCLAQSASMPRALQPRDQGDARARALVAGGLRTHRPQHACRPGTLEPGARHARSDRDVGDRVRRPLAGSQVGGDQHADAPAGDVVRAVPCADGQVQRGDEDVACDASRPPRAPRSAPPTARRGEIRVRPLRRLPGRAPCPPVATARRAAARRRAWTAGRAPRRAAARVAPGCRGSRGSRAGRWARRPRTRARRLEARAARRARPPPRG